MQCAMDHIVLNVEDDEKMIAFYTSVLQLAPERMQEYHAGTAPFASVRLNPNTIIDLFPRRMWQKNAPNSQGREHLNHFCMAMDKKTWNDLLVRLKANAIAIE